MSVPARCPRLQVILHIGRPALYVDRCQRHSGVDAALGLYPQLEVPGDNAPHCYVHPVM